MGKQPQVTTESKTFTVRVSLSTKTRLRKLIRDKAVAESRDVTERELADKYVNDGITRDERKLKIA